MIYVGSAESSDHDQVLDSVLVGPVPGGRHMFVFQVIIVCQEIVTQIITNIKVVLFVKK